MSYTCRNVVQLAAILHRSSPVDTGVLVVQSSDDVPQSGTTRTQSVNAVFFTRVHFDIFGLFFPNDVPDLGSATKLLMRVYDVENLTLCVAISPQQSSPSFSLLPNTRCEGVVNRTLGQRTEVFNQELITLRWFYLAFSRTKHAQKHQCFMWKKQVPGRPDPFLSSFSSPSPPFTSPPCSPCSASLSLFSPAP